MKPPYFFSTAARRLQKAVLPENVKRVEVIAVGRTRIITPAGDRDEWFDGHNVSADFMDNENTARQDRESL